MPETITIITPCFNESTTVITFLERLEEVLASLPHSFTLIVVNDCSTDDTLPLLNAYRFRSGALSMHVVSLTHNSGHQAAIYHGLRYAQALSGDRFVVMDSDGQDAPAVIPLLLSYRGAGVVHVVRKKRNEPAFFRFSYFCYQLLFVLVTGKRMNFGNFCLINRDILNVAVASGFTHFPAFLSRQKCDRAYVIASREKRLGGSSKMNFVKLFLHALRSFGEYGYGRQTGFFKRSFSK